MTEKIPKLGMTPSAKKAAKAAGVIALFVVGFLIVGFYMGWLGSIFQPPGPTPPGEGPIGYNATVIIRNSKGQDITILTEVRLWKTYNYSDISTWSVIDVGQNWTGTDFYHAGWINGACLNYNLTGFDALNRSLIYFVEVQAWWMLEEWMDGVYTPPAWWIGSALDMESEASYIRECLEEGETCVTWQQIWSGKNTITLIAEPSKNYLAITNTDTLQQWQEGDGAYPNSYTSNFRIDIKNLVNESYRGFNQEYSYMQKEWYGAWLVASSDAEINIVNYYTDSYGSDFLKWFNVTSGWWYAGVIFDNSITTEGIYDCAMLLPTFSYDYTFFADIKIANGASGIHFYLGKGPESNIQIIAEL